MKKILPVLCIMLTTFHVSAEWKLDNNNKEVSAYVFSDGIKNSLSVYCSKETKFPIIMMLSEDNHINRPKSIVSFSFDDKDRKRVAASYTKNTATVTELTLTDPTSPDKLTMKELVSLMKNHNKVTIGYVLSNNQSKRVDFTLKGSSRALSAIERFCDLK